MTHLRKMMLEELERRNYAQTTIDCYLRVVAEFSPHFHRPPSQLGQEHIRLARDSTAIRICASQLPIP